MGVEVLLAGNMGEGALKTLNNAGIEVLRGCSGNVQEVAQKWLDGSLISSSELCHNHDCNS
ncbi:Dinitrogenase iron-molybdenum cofactor [compost metagenome]